MTDAGSRVPVIAAARARVPAAAIARVTVLVLLLALVYRHTLAGLWGVWTTNGNYSHGPLVPLVSLGLVVARRERLRALPRSGDAAGLALVAIACALQVTGVRADVFALQGWSLPVMLLGLALALLGRPLARALAFPIGYLGFMLTFPPLVMERLSFALKEATVTAAAGLAETLGVALQRSGTTLVLRDGALGIEDPCSGLRSLLAMLAVGALAAALLRGGPGRRLLLVALAVPLAMLGNVLRITLLLAVAHYGGIARALGPFHETAGYLGYGLSIAGLVAAWAWLGGRPAEAG